MRNRTVFLFSVALAALVLCFAVSGPAEAQQAQFPTVDFGAVLLGQNHVSRIAVTETVSGALSVQISGTNASDFTLVGTLPATVTKGDTTNIDVKFTPSALGTRTAVISIVTNALDLSYSYSYPTLTGIGALPPSITTQPQSQAVCAGSPVSFTAAADGTPASTVQWQVNTDIFTDTGSSYSGWTDIPRATSTTLSFTAQGEFRDGGSLYRAVFTNAVGSTTSDAATLTVYDKPVADVVDSQIGDSDTLCSGNSTNVFVSLSGTAPWTITWSDGLVQSNIMSNSVSRAVSPTTTTTYALKSVSDAHCTTGTVRLSRTITVIPKPTAAVSGNATICAGQSATLSVALTGAPPWSITWSDTAVQSGIMTSPATRTVSPASTTTYSVTAASDSGSCGAGSASGSATITVNPVPTAQVSGDATVCAGHPATLSVTLTGTGPWSIQWSDGVTETATSSPWTRTVSPGGSTTYTLTAVSDAHCSGSATGSATVTVNNPPAVTGQPGPQNLCAGQTASFTAAATGTPAPAVQWQVSAPGSGTWSGILGATNLTLSFAATAADSGKQYRARFSNTCGLATSTAALLTVHTLSIQCPGSLAASADSSCQALVPDITAQVTVIDGCGKVALTQKPAAHTPVGLGSVSIAVTASDDGGNTTSCTTTFTVTDTSKPAITGCPGNQTLTGTCLPGGLFGAIASFNDATVTDNCGYVSVTCTAPLGPGGAAVPVTSGSTVFPAGSTTVTDSAMDTAGNSATCSFNVAVSYQWSGVLQPINADGSSVFKLGSTVPVKFALTDASACVTNAVATLSYTQVGAAVAGAVNEAVSTSAATSGNLFRYTGGQYLFNWSTKGLAPGTYQLQIDLGDGVMRTVTVGLK